MHPMIDGAGHRAHRAAGFTLVELMVTVGIFGFLLAFGVPAMSRWSQATKAVATSEFYAEGFRLARAQALRHNSDSRIRLTENANGRLDWQVDICFATPEMACTDAGASWSTVDAIAGGDPEGANGYKSVLRRADGLPGSGQLTHTIAPLGASDVYYTPLGWVNPAFAGRLQRITLSPATAGAFPNSAVAVTLAGMAIKCAPDAPDHDSRKCP
ncbi:MAG: GspH/FimT family pseudopilin [Massilia sp.]